MKIGIYGGTFNPVHAGHVGIARRAIDDLALDKLIVVPTSLSPFKAGNREPDMPWDRMELVQAAFRDIEKTTVDLREINRGGVSYTIDTVREISAENPGAELFFIIGEDNVGDLSKWKDAVELTTLCKFKAYPRTRESSSEIRRLFASAKVEVNPEEKIASAVRAGIVRKGGYCPCRIPKTPEFFCPCDEFKSQLADSSYHGPCHCRLYVKP